MEEKKISNENDNQINNENNKGNSLNNILSKTLKNTSSAFIISILSKIINLLFNIILIRHISKGAYGTVKIYLKFALSLVCFFPRENIRKTAQKFYPDKDNKRELNNYYLVCQVYTLILIPMIIYCFLLFIGFITFDTSGNMKINIIHLMIYIFSGMSELLVEPVILYMNLHMENILIVSTIGNFVKIISNVFFVVFFKFDLWAFTLSQIIGSFCYLVYIVYLGKFRYKLNFMNFIPKNFNIFTKKTKIS
jgi:O-antigen/teichoic acid export membrane protein